MQERDIFGDFGHASMNPFKTIREFERMFDDYQEQDDRGPHLNEEDLLQDLFGIVIKRNQDSDRDDNHFYVQREDHGNNFNNPNQNYNSQQHQNYNDPRTMQSDSADISPPEVKTAAAHAKAKIYDV